MGKPQSVCDCMGMLAKLTRSAFDRAFALSPYRSLPQVYKVKPRRVILAEVW